jgi:RNA polymerase sigma-70 factor (ECF subfamily)
LNRFDPATVLTNAIVPRAELPAGGEAPLLRELAAGDATGMKLALERWFHRHQPGVYAFAYVRLGRDPDLAADATQATFEQALRRLAEFDPQRGDMAIWLCTLARNVIRRLLRQHRKDAQLDSAERCIDETLLQSLRQIDRQPLPQSVLERQETRDLVTMTLANLPSQYQEVLEARYLQGQPLESIARQRKATLDGAKATLRRARAAFRDCFLALASWPASTCAKVEVGDVRPSRRIERRSDDRQPAR